MSAKPKPGGKLITSDAYIEEVEMYDAKKNANAVTSESQMMCKRPMLSTSGIQKLHANIVREDSDTELDTDDSENCYVCGQFSPTNLDTRPHIKIVNWGQCDECGHWSTFPSAIQNRCCEEETVSFAHTVVKIKI
ncbi:hypothetical protein DPMN_183684 [Dreissena polymorpha]|uniref:Uncharacterized protein n=1 Tax=Dreissena polymorpha TaxID=45954 RepID=A0A9D4DHU1_DREPO|nr:hypothetical protein DPMN_183684 [Dreissena polymorpha]